MLMSLSVTLGLIPAVGVYRGPTTLGILSGLSAGLVFMISTIATACTVNPAVFNDQCTGPVMVGLLAGACNLVVPVYVLISSYSSANRHNKMAPLVSQFLLERFDDINLARDGVITSSDLDHALAIPALPKEMRKVLAYAKAEQGAIGHITGSYMTEETVYVPFGYMAVPATQQVEKHTYGICRADLEAYPAKVKNEFKDWLE